MPHHDPLKEPSRALKITVIAGVCIAVIMTLIVFIDPLSPRLFAGAANYSFAVGNGLNPGAQTIYMVSSHREVDWSAVADATWLRLDPLGGRTDEETPITMSVDISGMYPGEYATSVTIFASAAKNTPIEIPVSLTITDTKETLAIKKAVSAETGDVEIRYDEQPPYSKGAAFSHVTLTNNPSATDPTWQQLLEFIESDNTDEEPYIEGAYVCGDFAETLHNNAEQEGIRAAWVAIDFADSAEGHALNAFHTVDEGIVFVDCTGGGFEVVIPSLGESRSHETDYDRIAYVKVGEEYGAIDSDIAWSPQYTFYEQYEQRWEEYETRLEEYNARVREYNKRVDVYNREISTGKYGYGAMWAEYACLQQEERRLKGEEEELNQLLEGLGYYRWESLGVVSHIEVYW